MSKRPRTFKFIRANKLSGKTWVTGPNIDIVLVSDDGAHFESLNGIIDTGASVICVDARIAKRLGLVASKKKPMQMADGRFQTATIYPVRMKIGALDFDNYVEVYAIEMASDAPIARVLIGRSFLKDYIVNYNGPTEIFEFHQTARGFEFYGHDHDE